MQRFAKPTSGFQCNSGCRLDCKLAAPLEVAVRNTGCWEEERQQEVGLDLRACQ
jgi:hypothetical protein